ncbi:MAG: DNA-directed RNA polymerase subunit omega [Lachnospiraceae bacterium]|nr:DNA-directed RNA polymerase subunit omega [Lachnospiraceae bacterium]
MLHPSYVELMDAVNQGAENESDQPIVSSRYSIVMASAKRARQIVAGDEAMAGKYNDKPLSAAVEEIYENKVRILPKED